jgi:hypothetical protein
MSENDVMMLKGELNTVKELMDEKWTSHDKRAEERWAYLMDKIHCIDNKKTPCVDHIRILEEFNGRLKGLEAWQTAVNWAIGVVYVAVVGALVKLFLG